MWEAYSGQILWAFGFLQKYYASAFAECLKDEVHFILLASYHAVSIMINIEKISIVTLV